MFKLALILALVWALLMLALEVSAEPEKNADPAGLMKLLKDSVSSQGIPVEFPAETAA